MYSDLMYNSLFVWDAGQLVQAALSAQQAGRPVTVPVDRLSMTGAQLPAATATRYDKTVDGNFFGTIYGVGSYSAKQGLPTVTLQNVPRLQTLAPAVYNAAKLAAEQAHEPVAPAMTPIESTVNSLNTRLWAQANIFLSTIWGSGQALLGQDNSETVASIKASQKVLETVGYDTANGTNLEINVASAARAFDGLVGGVTTLATNFVGTILRVGTKIGSFFGAERPALPQSTDFLYQVDTESLTSNISTATFSFLWYNPIKLTVETVYHMGQALVARNWEDLRNASYDLLALGLLSKASETPTSKRDMQLAVKQVGFLEQQLTRGAIEETPLRDLQFETPGRQQFVVEAAKKNAAGEVVTDGRIVTAETFAGESKGSYLIDAADGETVLNTPRSAGACFIAGTLVHTDKGLVPIEELRVGDMVLSQPEMKGDQAYKRVINTFVFENKEVRLIRFARGEEIEHLVATENHPFWVKDKGWIQASHLDMGEGHELEFTDGTHGMVVSSVPLFQTTRDEVGWAFGLWGSSDDSNHEIDLRGGAVAIGPEGEVDISSPQRLLTTRVFNIEVEGFHTYYVGESGAWVHNTNCGGEGIKPENPNIELRPGSQTKVYDVNDSYKLDRREGVILVKERIRGDSPADLFERNTDFALTTADGWSTPYTLLFENSKGENAIRLGDGLQRMPDGSPSMTTIDAKSGPLGLGPLYDLTKPESLRKQLQTKALESFRKASEALEQNPGRTHIVEFETKTAFDIAARFFSERVAKEGYADNIMLRLRGQDYLTGETALRGREPVVTFDRAGNATRIENPTFRKASEGPNPTMDVANEFKSSAELLAEKQVLAELKETCFSSDTVVHMEGGKFEKIKYVPVGAKVLSRCEITGEMAYKKVIKKFHHEFADDANKDAEIPAMYLCYTTIDPKGKRAGALHVTPEHPIWVNGKGWTAVRDIKPGDELGNTDGAQVVVDRIDTDGSTYNVYNLHVEDFHTYFVGTGIWVHNQKISELVSARKLQEATDAPASRVNPALAGEMSLVELKAQAADLLSDPVGNKDAISKNLGKQGQLLGSESLRKAGIDNILLKDGSGQSNGMGKKPLTEADGLYGVGETIEYYTPNGGSLGSVYAEIKKKSREQSSTLMVVLTNEGAPALTVRNLVAVLDTVTDTQGPIGSPIGLKTLFILDQQGVVWEFQYPKKTDANGNVTNRAIYGTVNLATGEMVELATGAAPPGLGKFALHQEVSAQGAGTNLNPLTQADIDAILPAARQYWLNQGAKASLLNTVQIGIGTLPAALAGINQGAHITLSEDGAGWGWFVDATPNASEEFVEDTAAQTLRAAPGAGGAVNPAAGKLDLLTVLIHELGHVLGAQDLPRAEDVMSGHLEAGERRAPNAQDAALWLAAQSQRAEGATSPAGFGVVAASATGGGSTGTGFVPTPVIALPAGSTLLALPALQDGNSHGSVAVANGSTLVLGESITAQAHLAQAFVLSAQDRLLTFNISDLSLHNNSVLQSGGSIIIDLGDLITDVDGNCLAVCANNPAKGTLTRNYDGTYTYRAKTGYTGTDTFTYTVNDGRATTTATITLNVVATLPASANRSASTTVSSAASPQESTGQQVRYVVINQHTGTEVPAGINWNSRANVEQMFGAVRRDDDWLSEILGDGGDESAEDIAARTGLKVKL